MSIDTGYADASRYFSFVPDSFTVKRTYLMKRAKYYPARIPPDKWPDTKLIGKAMVKGWAVPCRYYMKPRRGMGKRISFVFPGITNYEMEVIHQIMRGAIYEQI